MMLGFYQCRLDEVLFYLLVLPLHQLLNPDFSEVLELVFFVIVLDNLFVFTGIHFVLVAELLVSFKIDLNSDIN